MMLNKKSWRFLLPIIILTGCASAPELTSAGASVDIKNGEPESTCRYIGKVEDSKNNFVSNPDEFRNEQDVLIRLKNDAAAKGANTLFHVAQKQQNFVSQFYPAPTVMSGDAYYCE